MPDGLDPRDLSARARTVVLLLLGAVAFWAGAGLFLFGLARGALDAQYEDLVRHRDAALLCYALAAAAVVGVCRWTRRWRLPSAVRRWPWLLGLAALVGVAGWLRVYRLAELPPGLWVDEALNGVQAVQIARTGRPLVALPSEDVRTGLGAAFVDVAALAFAVVDPDDGPYALRAVAALIGSLGVAGLAALAWCLFGPRAAVAATAWLAVSQWHLNYSRWGEMPIMSSVVETGIVLGLVIGFRTRGWRSWSAFLAAGLLAGAGLYTYQTFRLFAVLAGICGLPIAVRHRRAVAAHGGALAAALLLALLVATPMLRYALGAPQQFAERAQGTLIFGRDDWREQLADSVPRSLLAFQLVGDDNPRHNLPLAPLLSPIPGVLAVLGLAVCLARWRALPYAIVALWFAIALVPGMITLEAPHASRLLDAIVPLALMVGIAADLLLGVIQAALPARMGLVAAVALALLAAALTALPEYRAYFVERERRPEFVDAFQPWESAPGRYLAAQAPQAVVFLDPTTYWAPATQFVARHYLAAPPHDVRMLRLQHDFPPAEPLEHDALYLLPRPYAPLAEVIRGLWPQAHCDEMRDAFGRIELVACRVPRSALDAAGPLRWPFGLRGRFYRRPDGSGAPDAEVMLAFPFIEYGLDEPPLGRFRRAEWDGFIELPAAGDYLFRLHPDSTSLTIDGQQIIADAAESAFGGGHEGRATLPAGRLPIRITLHPRDRYFLWFFWQPPHGEVGLVPSSVLFPPNQGTHDAG